MLLDTRLKSLDILTLRYEKLYDVKTILIFNKVEKQARVSVGMMNIQ